MEIEKAGCNIDLALSIGSHDNISISHDVQLHNLFPHRPKEEEIGEEEEQETKRSRISIDGDEEDSLVRGARKKLRLTQEQAILLEDAFNLNNTLNSFQKQELAEKLKLRPRQVEVWFQNRRARNKLKQTEVDFQLLKKWCETLNEENQRLKKDLVDLKRSAFYLGSPKAASEAMKMTLCTSCARSITSCKKSSSEDSSIA